MGEIGTDSSHKIAPGQCSDVFAPVTTPLSVGDVRGRLRGIHGAGSGSRSALFSDSCIYQI